MLYTHSTQNRDSEWSSYVYVVVHGVSVAMWRLVCGPYEGRCVGVGIMC